MRRMPARPRRRGPAVDRLLHDGPQAKPVGEVILSGPGSSDAELVESLSVHLGIPTSVAAPLEH